MEGEMMKPSMYKKYVEERTNKKVLETKVGFAVYEITGNECYIEDIYVERRSRRSREAADMADLIAYKAKNEGCKYLTGSVDPFAKGADISEKVLLGYGMKYHSTRANGLRIFYKEI